MNHLTGYKCSYFRIEELVPEPIFYKLGDASWELLDTSALITIDQIREYFNVALVINNWLSGGKFMYRGYRPPAYKEGAEYSQHRAGRAFDIGFPKDFNMDSVRQTLIKKHLLFPYLTAIEDSVSWLHIDCRNRQNENILLFKE